jgi:hypothetical protein
MNADQDGAQARLVPAPPLPRLTAFALDAVAYLIIPARLLPLGLLLIRHGVMLSSAAVNAIGLVLVIAPATAWATWCEARPRKATPGPSGKPLHDRLAGTVVVRTGSDHRLPAAKIARHPPPSWTAAWRYTSRQAGCPRLAQQVCLGSRKARSVAEMMTS